MTRAPALPLALALLAAAAAAAAPRQLAVLVGKDLGSLDQAADGVARVEGVETHVFRLYEGTTAIDAAVAALESFPFDGVVALGGSAHEFARSRELRQPYAATLVLASKPEDEASVVPFEASPDEWVALLEELLPEVRQLGALVSGPEAEARLAPLAAALEASGRRLVTQRLGGRTPLTVALRRLLRRCQAFYFHRDRGLLAPAVARAVLKGAYRAQVPVLAFSRALVQAGALASLDVDPGDAGERAARRVLGLPEVGLGARRTVNPTRRQGLGKRGAVASRRRQP